MAEAGNHLGNMFRRFLHRQASQDEKKEKEPSKASPKEGSKDQTPTGSQFSTPPKPKPERVKKKQWPIKAKIEKAKRIEEEEAEEFEQVQGARPALCTNKRQAKLKWKKDDDDSMKKCEATQDKADSSSAESPPSPSKQATKELNVEPLKGAVAELALDNRKLKEMVERLRQRLARRGKKIEKLQKKLKAKVSSNTGSEKSERAGIVSEIKKEIEAAKAQLVKQNEEAEKNKIEMEKLLGEVKKSTAEKKTTKVKAMSTEVEDLDAATQTSATRILEVLKRNQLLEKALPSKENTVLYNFFSSGATTKPSNEVLTLLDKAISIGIDTLISRPQDLDDPIDNQMRQLLIETTKAKSILLEVMLLSPVYVPVSWGGKVLVGKSLRIIRVASAERPKPPKDDSKDERSVYFPTKK